MDRDVRGRKSLLFVTRRIEHGAPRLLCPRSPSAWRGVRGHTVGCRWRCEAREEAWTSLNDSTRSSSTSRRPGRRCKGAVTESREQLKKRIDQAQVHLDQAVKNAHERGEQAGAGVHSKWAEMRADAAAKREDVRAKINKRTRQLDAKVAASDADWAEADAADALDYAEWALDTAQLAMLDAIDARTHANELAKAASS